jgi:hypothetical protein
MAQCGKLALVARFVTTRDELLARLKTAHLCGNQPMAPAPSRVGNDRRDAIGRDDDWRFLRLRDEPRELVAGIFLRRFQDAADTFGRVVVGHQAPLHRTFRLCRQRVVRFGCVLPMLPDFLLDVLERGVAHFGGIFPLGNLLCVLFLPSCVDCLKGFGRRFDGGRFGRTDRGSD